MNIKTCLLNKINIYSVSRKKRPTFFVISPVKLGWFWWNLVHRLLNKSAPKSCKRFPPHLNDVSILLCETWNAHWTPATIELWQKLQNLFHLNCGPKFARYESSWLQCVGAIATEGVQNMHHSSGWTETVTEKRVGQAGSCHHCGSYSSVAMLIATDQWYVFCTPSLAIFPTCCYQLNSNLLNLEATVEEGYILEFLSATTQW